MAIDNVDLNNVVVEAQIKAQKERIQEDSQELARRAADRKLLQKKTSRKESLRKDALTSRETYQVETGVRGRLQRILGGSEGGEPADALRAWSNDTQLQSKLSDAQKRYFQQEYAKNPERGSRAARATVRLAQEPTFRNRLETSEADAIHRAVSKNPASESSVRQLLNTEYVGSPTRDVRATTQLLSFGLKQAVKGGTELHVGSVKHASDMLVVLDKTDTPKGAHRAAMSMAIRHPGDTQAMDSVGKFATNADVRVMPKPVRGRATTLLAESDGRTVVRDGFEKIARNAVFKGQNPTIQGRFFATIGSGKPSEYRALADNSLQVLQHDKFPEGSREVSRLLRKMAVQAKAKGADGIDASALLARSRSSLPDTPALASVLGLDSDEASRVHAHNRAKVIRYYTQVMRYYDAIDKRLKSAKYAEDVYKYQNIREASTIETEHLSPEEQSFIRDRQIGVKERCRGLTQYQKQRARELRGKRMPAAKRRALANEVRPRGPQSKYFRLENSAISGSNETSSVKWPVETQENEQSLKKTPVGGEQSINSDFVPRVFEPDLGWGHRQAVRPRQATSSSRPVLEADLQTSSGEGVSPDSIQARVGSVLAQVSGSSMSLASADAMAEAIAHQVAAQVANEVRVQLRGAVGQGSDGGGGDIARTLALLMAVEWAQLSRSEVVALRNLGWDQQRWAARLGATAQWPSAMVTSFANLALAQREAVHLLGMTEKTWNSRVAGLTMGRNA